MSGRAHLKDGTRRIQKYLVEASIESTGRASWMEKCRADPDTPTHQMKISVFLRCGEIIANDPPRAALIPNSVLHHLRDVISLRDAEIALRAPLVKSNLKIKENSDRHVAFNAVLKDILRMLTIALRRRSQRQNESTGLPELDEYDSNLFRHLDVEDNNEVPETQNDDEIRSELNVWSHNLDIKEDEIDQQDIENFLGHNVLLLKMQQDVLDVWAKCQANELSPAASGVITGFEYQLIRAEISKIEVVEQIPLVQFSNISDAGIAGLLHLLYQNFHGQALRSSFTTVQNASARDVARTLFMPTLESYLFMLNLKFDGMSTYISRAINIPPFPTPKPPTKSQTVEQIEASRNIGWYDWQASCSLDLIKACKVMGALECSEGRPCYSTMDALTRSLPKTLQADKPEFWEVVALDLLLRVLVRLNENGDLLRQGQALLQVADHVEAQGDQWLAGKLNVPQQLGVAIDTIKTVIRKDSLMEMGKKYNHILPPQLMLHYNPTLNGFTSQAILLNLGDAVGVAEAVEPVATSVAIFYKAITSLGFLRNAWPEMEFLIEFYGLGSVLGQNTLPTSFHDFYQQARLMLLSGRPIEFLQPTSFQTSLRKWVSDCSTENFHEMASFIIVHLRRKKSSCSIVATESELELESDMTSELISKFTSATNLEDAGATNTEGLRLALWSNDLRTHSQLEQDSPPITPTSKRPTHTSNEPDEQERQTEKDPQTSETLDHDEFGPREIFQAFVQLVQAQDVVAHLAKGTIWLECTQLASHIKDFYVGLTKDQPFVSSTEDYKYIPLFLEYLYRNNDMCEAVLQNGVLGTFSKHIKKTGGKHLQRAKDISGVDWKRDL